MDTPTDTNQNKRARFAEKLPGNIPAGSPLDAALHVGNIHLASLSDSVKDICETFFKEFISLQSEKARHDATKARISSDSFTPSSARLSFKITMSDR
eukprot:CAMPEP_0176016278 /NCGR_PEP_ID=MMETSP0120_2-20121206/7767_1 /TAXON_ID=160619 /ORGANISM="Kryptoperidinium foliaceum, Strain CCMP 1326" /LENGTH=96 /DNA_ID=CAMNT_0017349267 /DNA_START=558 /DNA_END=845 /DNA_ORIENTATION=+